MTLTEQANRIKAVILDIDGVLTDGRIGYDGSGEIKFFHVRDGHGIKLAKRAGLKVGALSGRGAAANRQRTTELGFDFVYEDRKDKLSAFELLLAENGLKAEECLYVGDDLVDAPVLKMAGIGVAVADAPAELDRFCALRTKLPGGRGAVREVMEWLLKEQGKWEELLKKYLA